MAFNPDNDYATSPVPLSCRRGPLTMGLLWITMVTSFTSLLIGFQWFKDGLTLAQVIQCAALGAAVLLIYSIPSAYLGSKSGQTYGMLSRHVFGLWGSRLVSCNYIWITAGWYAITALMLAQMLDGLFHPGVPIMVLAVGLSFIMAFNNFFGFTGVANFARYLAAPLLIGLGIYTFAKVLPTCSPSVIHALPHVPFSVAITSVTGFVIGVGVWGNEADYWRYGKPKRWFAALPLICSLCIGQVMFPATGWMVARISGLTDYGFGPATHFMNDYGFGGIPLIAAIVMTASSLAMNDSNLYGMINAVENLKTLPHPLVCGVLATICAVSAAWLSATGLRDSLEAIASLSCIFLPVITVVMIVEFFFMRRALRIETDFSQVPHLSELPAIQWSGFGAVLVGFTIGLATSGVVPGTKWMQVGLCSVQAWLAAAIVYVPLRWWEHRRLKSKQQLLEKKLRQGDDEIELQLAR